MGNLIQKRLLRIWRIAAGWYNNTKSFLFTSTSNHYFTSSASAQSAINGMVGGASKSFTTSYWLQFSTNSAGVIHSMIDNTGLFTVVQMQQYIFNSAGNMKMFVQMVESGTKYLYNISTTNLSINTWYNITVSYNHTLADAAKIKVYINGTLDGSACVAAGGYAAPRTTSAMNTIGRIYDGSKLFDGYIHQFAFWNSALIQANITSLYNSGHTSDFRKITGCALFMPARNAIFSANWTWTDLVNGFTFTSTGMGGTEQIDIIP